MHRSHFDNALSFCQIALINCKAHGSYQSTSSDSIDYVGRNSTIFSCSSVHTGTYANTVAISIVKYLVYNKAFVTCSLSAKYVGFVLMVYGVSDSISSLVIGQIVKTIGRWPCFTIGALINYSLITIMFVWQPTKNPIGVLFILAGLWGVADAIWITLINAFYGVIFDDNSEAAFSNYRLWESCGYLLIVAITPYIHVHSILIILVVFLSLGMSGYGFVEYRWQKHGANTKIYNQL